jgi:predicted 3-demethylubiquinone-9 3-methyltransferase (glyoxalase superfamily)
LKQQVTSKPNLRIVRQFNAAMEFVFDAYNKLKLVHVRRTDKILEKQIINNNKKRSLMRRKMIFTSIITFLLFSCNNNDDKTINNQNSSSMQKTTTSLMFVGDNCGKAEEAIRFYTSLFKNSEIKSINYWSDGEPGGEEGLVKLALFTLSGQEYMASENTGKHNFSFTPSISIFVNCESEEEINYLFNKLSEGGIVMMPPDDYGFSKKFAFIQDKYGVSWQLNIK